MAIFPIYNHYMAKRTILNPQQIQAMKGVSALPEQDGTTYATSPDKAEYRTPLSEPKPTLEELNFMRQEQGLSPVTPMNNVDDSLDSSDPLYCVHASSSSYSLNGEH